MVRITSNCGVCPIPTVGRFGDRIIGHLCVIAFRAAWMFFGPETDLMAILDLPYTILHSDQGARAECKHGYLVFGDKRLRNIHFWIPNSRPTAILSGAQHRPENNAGTYSGIHVRLTHFASLSNFILCISTATVSRNHLLEMP